MFDESEPEPAVEFDTPNHTKFHPDDMDSPNSLRLDGSRSFRRHYEYLGSYNRGTHNCKWADNTLLRRQDNLAILDAVADSLELSEYHHRVAREVMRTVPLRKWSSPDGVDVYIVAFCICQVVLRKDPRSHRSFWHNASPEKNDPLSAELWDLLGYRNSEFDSCYQKVLRHVDWEPVDWGEYPQ